MATIKTYRMWTALLAHHAEGSYRKAVEGYENCEGDLNGAKEELQSCQERRKELEEDVKKYDAN